MTEKGGPLVRVAVIGAGVRGTSLARRLAASGFRALITAVAEPDEARRKAFAREFGLSSANIFNTWEDLTTEHPGCDAAVIATLDNQHAGPALACLNNGWHILLEKPLADNLEDCMEIVRSQKAKDRIVAVCHTLRFMEGYRTVRDLVSKGSVGRIIHIEHMEAIGHMRFAHNYVRSRWAREKDNTFLLLHKCSHDIDYISWLFSEKCIRVSSFGSLSYFRPEMAPPGSTTRCTDGCLVARSCPYSAVRIYVEGKLDEWPARDISPVHTAAEHMNRIRNTSYGLCVWHAGNDVVDHQVVMMEFADGATATCTLTGYSPTNGRRIRVQGTKGEILFDEAAGTIVSRNFTGSEEKILRIDPPETYHPEDQDIADEWLSSIINSTSVTVDASEALRTHAVVFAAEISRKEKRVVEMDELMGTF